MAKLALAVAAVDKITLWPGASLDVPRRRKCRPDQLKGSGHDPSVRLDRNARNRTWTAFAPAANAVPNKKRLAFLEKKIRPVLIKSWRLDYNRRHPHSALEYQTPTEFAAASVDRNSAPARKPHLLSVAGPHVGITCHTTTNSIPLDSHNTWI